MHKPIILYTALSKAVDNYNDRHYLDRSHLANVLGFTGENAAIQFSNTLNPKNDDKSLNDERKYLLLHAIDHAARMIFFTEWMRQWGLRPVSIEASPVPASDMDNAADEAAIESDEAFIAVKRSPKDSALSRKQLAAIIKESTEAAAKHYEVVDIARKRLKAMEEG